jgi:hypothetical protein
MIEMIIIIMIEMIIMIIMGTIVRIIMTNNLLLLMSIWYKINKCKHPGWLRFEQFRARRYTLTSGSILFGAFQHEKYVG